MGEGLFVLRGAPDVRTSPWTMERIERLRRLWSEGATARQISQELGPGISRGAVLGKLHRLRLVETANHARGRAEAGKAVGELSVSTPGRFADLTFSRRHRALPTWVLNAKPYIDDRDLDGDIAVSQRRSLLELDSGSCRWPVGDPSQSDFFFCGATTLATKPYCAAHCARAYRNEDEGSKKRDD